MIRTMAFVLFLSLISFNILASHFDNTSNEYSQWLLVHENNPCGYEVIDSNYKFARELYPNAASYNATVPRIFLIGSQNYITNVSVYFEEWVADYVNGYCYRESKHVDFVIEMSIDIGSCGIISAFVSPEYGTTVRIVPRSEYQYEPRKSPITEDCRGFRLTN